MPFSIIFGYKFPPTTKFAPTITVSGRSVEILVVTQGFLNQHKSSSTVPESVIPMKQFFSSFVKSKNPKEFVIVIPSGILISNFLSAA